jgi:hypothetical protein
LEECKASLLRPIRATCTRQGHLHFCYGRHTTATNGYRSSFPGGKAARGWSWPFISTSAKVKKMWFCTATPPYTFMA